SGSAPGSERGSVSGAALPPLPVGVTNAGRLYACDVEGWPPTLQVLCEHMEHELPFHREPLALQLEAMAAAPGSGSSGHGGGGGGGRGAPGPPAVGPALADAHLVDLHPASWFAAAWYPVYRIPESPLPARFLCFYSLAAPLQLLAEAEAAAGAGGGLPAGAAGLRLPIVGLKWCDLRGERWFEPIAAEDPAAHADGSDCGSDSGSSGGDDDEEGQADGAGGSGPAPKDKERGDEDAGAPSGGQEGGAEDRGAEADGDATSCSSGSCSCCAPAAASAKGGAPGGGWSELELTARLEELQATAERLARGSWLRVLDAQGARALKLYHSDFEFFYSRSG
ncbi:hypothetical protein MNEG_6847, partial [Monoraphidium neglectum]